MRWPWQKKKESVPYWLRYGMEDVITPNVRILLEIQQFLTVIENELEIQRQLIGEIRNGQYDKNQPARTRVNGKLKERR